MKSKITKNFIELMIVIIASSVLFMLSCMKEEKKSAKSIEQIRQEEGIPVKVMEVEYKKFNKYLTFFAKMSGIKEIITNSKIADKVVKLNAGIGDYVKENQIVAVFPSDNPQLQYSQAKAAYENSEKTYNRMKELLKAGETSQQNFDGAETQYLVSKRNYESLKQIIYLESPIDGIITEIFIKEGQFVDDKKPVFTVAQLNVMRTKVWVSDKEISQIRNGMPASVVWTGREFAGRVSEVSLAMDSYNRAFGVEIQVPNPGQVLKSGVTADVKIKTYENPRVIIIPNNLIIKDQGKSFIYLENNGSARLKEIQTGQQNAIDVEVLSGIEPGDKIITTGTNLLSDGKKVKVIQ